jgi:hypothetical protein
VLRLRALREQTHSELAALHQRLREALEASQSATPE